MMDVSCTLSLALIRECERERESVRERRDDNHAPSLSYKGIESSRQSMDTWNMALRYAPTRAASRKQLLVSQYVYLVLY